MPGIPSSPSSRRTGTQLNEHQREGLVSTGVVCMMPLAVVGILAVINRPYVMILTHGKGAMLGVLAACLVVIALCVMSWITLGTRTGEAAAKLGPRLTVPMVLLILPAMFAILVGPSAITIMERQAAMDISGMRPSVQDCTRRTMGQLMQSGVVSAHAEATVERLCANTLDDIR